MCPASLIRLDRFSQFLLLIWFLANRAEGSGEQKKWSNFSNGADWVCHFSLSFILLPFLNVRTSPSTACFQFELNSCSSSRTGHDEFLDTPLNRSWSIWEAYQWNSDLWHVICQVRTTSQWSCFCKLENLISEISLNMYVIFLLSILNLKLKFESITV